MEPDTIESTIKRILSRHVVLLSFSYQIIIFWQDFPLQPTTNIVFFFWDMHGQWSHNLDVISTKNVKILDLNY